MNVSMKYDQGGHYEQNTERVAHAHLLQGQECRQIRILGESVQRYGVGRQVVGRHRLGDHRPACPIDIKHDFTWSRLDGTTAFTLTDCRPPQNVVLYNDGTWGWAN